ncbi:hypothetical protein J6TS2_37880 [Heyndrickxia sporothermodurans]|nr:hypothetical protein J6TS2_37880 [Heyndrickxia sporothermodurans]
MLFLCFLFINPYLLGPHPLKNSKRGDLYIADCLSMVVSSFYKNAYNIKDLRHINNLYNDLRE